MPPSPNSQVKVTEEQINNKELIALVISLRKTLLILSGIIWIVGDCSSDLGNCAWKPNAFTGSKFMLIGLEEASRINYHSSRKNVYMWMIYRFTWSKQMKEKTMRITLSRASGNNSRESNMGNGKMKCGEKISIVNELKSCGQHQRKKTQQQQC